MFLPFIYRERARAWQSRICCCEGKSRDQINAIFRVEEKGEGGEGGVEGEGDSSDELIFNL